MTCAATLSDTAFVRGVLDYIDCQAQTIGGTGYQALAAPGSVLSLVLGAFLTLFIALFGYRMLFGRTPGVGDGVTAFVKIGIVLALAGSWPVYRTLVYDVALHGPAELATAIGAPSGLPGAGGGLVERLDVSDFNLTSLAVLGPGDPNVAAAQAAAANPNQPAPNVTPQPFAGFNGFALGLSRLLFLGGAIGGLAGVRIIAGLLLALGPFFAAFLLFESTRGLFEGWVRALAGAALGALGVAVALGIELALIEPWLPDLIARRIAGEALPAAPTELLVVSLVFDLVLIAVIAASTRVAMGFKLSSVLRAPRQGDVIVTAGSRAVFPMVREGAAAPAEQRSRAGTVVDAVAAMQRRESSLILASAAGGAAAEAAAAAPRGAVIRPQTGRDMPSTPPPPPLGQGLRRRTRTRVSASAGRRDVR